MDCENILQLPQEVSKATVETMRYLQGSGSILKSYTIYFAHDVCADDLKLGIVYCVSVDQMKGLEMEFKESRK